MKDFGPLHFLGVSLEQQHNNLFLYQRQHAQDILEAVGMSDCKPWTTPVDTQAKVSSDMGAPVTDPTAYRSLVGTLQNLPSPGLTSTWSSRRAFACTTPLSPIWML
jgi:hypothetical protein